MKSLPQGTLGRVLAMVAGGIVVLSLALMTPGESLGSESVWSATPVADYHEACVHLWTPGEKKGVFYGGSGTVIRASERGILIISVEHLAGKGDVIRAEFPSGAEAYGIVLATGPKGSDLSLISCSNTHPLGKDLPVVPIASSPPKAGAVVELTGFGVDGDGGDNLRHWSGRLFRYDHEDMVLETSVVSGDSGGGIIYEGKLVGVIWGGRYRTDLQDVETDKGMFVHPARGNHLAVIQNFLKDKYPDVASGYSPDKEKPIGYIPWRADR